MKIKEKSKLICLSQIFFGGVLYACGYPLFGTSYYLFIAPIVGFYFYFKHIKQEQSIIQSIFKTFIFCLGLCLCAYYWIPQAIFNFWHLDATTSNIFFFISIFLIFPHMFLFGLLSPLIHKLLNNKSIKENEGLKNIITASIFILIQYNLPQLFNGFPGHSWIQLAPYLLPAQYFGEYLYSFVSIIIALEALSIQRNKRFNKINMSFILIFLVTSLFFPIKKIGPIKYLNTRIVQGNINNDDKVIAEKNDFSKKDEIITTYEIFSQEGLPKDNDLIIWPETAYPENIHPLARNKSSIFLPKRMQNFLTLINTNLVYGGNVPDFSSKTPQTFNSVIHSSAKSNNQIYYKNFLMPFGEYLPLVNLYPEKMRETLTKSTPRLSPSKKSEVFNLLNKDNKEISFVTPICYEVLSTHYLRRLFNSSNQKVIDLIINLSNDSWYGYSSEPEQHLLLSKWRAVELNTPLIRSTNSGITSIILENGKELLRTNLFKRVVVDQVIKIQEQKELTFYQKNGCIPIIILIFVLIILNLIASVPRLKDRT